MIETVLRIVLPIYFLLALAAVAVTRSRVLKQTGHDPVVIRPLQKGETPHGYLESVLVAGVLAMAIDILLNAAAPGWVGQQLSIPVLRQATILRWLGLGAVTAGLLLSSVAVRSMGTDWRMGIDHVKPGSLVTGGPFTRMRHPIYAGMLLVTAGLAAATGDALAVAVAAAACVGLPVQARLEEQFMLSRHGDAYRAYLARTRRFWPRAR